MAYTDNTVDHITIESETKYYEDREARANKAEGKGISFQTDANYNLSGIYTDEQGNAHPITFPGGDPADVEGRLGDCEQNILALALAFAMEQEAEAEGMSDNIVVEVFADNTGFILISGAYDSTNHRIYA